MDDTATRSASAVIATAAASGIHAKK